MTRDQGTVPAAESRYLRKALDEAKAQASKEALREKTAMELGAKPNISVGSWGVWHPWADTLQ